MVVQRWWKCSLSLLSSLPSHHTEVEAFVASAIPQAVHVETYGGEYECIDPCMYVGTCVCLSVCHCKSISMCVLHCSFRVVCVCGCVGGWVCECECECVYE